MMLFSGFSTDTKIGDYVIKEGTIVFINLYSMTQDPKLWGNDVEEFKMLAN